MPTDTGKRTRSVLKTYFAKNAIPTDTQFADLIDASLNQRDDGIRKGAGEPLGIEAGGDDGGTKRAVAFYSSFTDPDPSWSIALQADAGAGGEARKGWSVLDASNVPRLTIDPATGNVGVGTLQPRERLEVDGRVRAGALTLGNWTADGNYAGIGITAGDRGRQDDYALLVGQAAEPGVTFLNAPSRVNVRIGNDDRIVVDPDAVTVTRDLRVAGTLTLSIGRQSGGITFPSDPGAGGGDSAWMRYYAREGESTTLEIGTSNDEADHITLMPGVRNGEPLANVGIATYEPQERLHVEGRVRAGPLTIGSWPPSGACAFVGNNTLDQNDPRNYALLQDQEGGGQGQTFLNSPLRIFVRIANQDRIVVDDGGVRVEAGLTIAGPIVPSIGGDERSGITFPHPAADGGGDGAYLRYFSRDGGEAMTLELGITNDANDHISLSPGNGSVGIGTRTPASKLDVDGDIAVRGRVAISNFGEPGDTWLRLNQESHFASGVHANCLFATQAINVGAATGTWDHNPGPGSIAYAGTLNKLDVGPEYTATVRCADFRMGLRRGEPGRALVDDGETLLVNYGGDWRRTVIGGDTVFTGQIQRSSGKLKDDIRPISSPDAAAIVEGLDPVSFRWKDSPGTQLGFVAERCPDAVTTEEHDGIYVSHIVAALTRVVRDQTATIAALQDRLGRVEARA